MAETILNKRYEAYHKRKIFFQKEYNKIKHNKLTVCYGNWKPARGFKYGHRRPPISYFLHFLRRRGIRTVKINEKNTSKLCHLCNNIMYNFYKNYVSDKKNGRREPVAIYEKKFCKLKFCKSCDIIINRDENASRNIVRLAHQQLQTDDNKRCVNFN